MKDFDNIEKEYIKDDDVFDDNNEVWHKLRSLSRTDQRILIMYAELGNIRDTAAFFRCSKTTMHAKLRKIKNKFK